MIVLGLLTSLTETLGVSLVVLFLYSATGKSNLAGQNGGLLGVWLDQIGPWMGGHTVLAFVIFLLIVARGLLALTYTLVNTAIGQRISESARNKLHEQYLTVSYEFIRKHEQGKLLEILATESWSIAAAHASFTRVVINLCAIVVFLSFLIALSWKITFLAFVGMLIVTLAVRWLSAPVRSLGADHMIDYTTSDFTEGDRPYDVVIDNVANRGILEVRRVLAPHGKHLLIGGGGTDANPWFGAFAAPLKGMVVSWFVDQDIGMFLSHGSGDDLATLAGLMQSGAISTVIDRRYPLAETAEAMRYLETGRARGKVIVTMP